MQYVIKGLVGLIALLFVVMGVNFLLNPVSAGGGIGLEALTVGGMSSLRGDLGGLFFGSAALLIYGIAKNQVGAFMAVAVYIGVIALCRLLGFANEGSDEASLTAFAAETVFVVILVFAALRLPALRQGSA